MFAQRPTQTHGPAWALCIRWLCTDRMTLWIIISEEHGQLPRAGCRSEIKTPFQMVGSLFLNSFGSIQSRPRPGLHVHSGSWRG